MHRCLIALALCITATTACSDNPVTIHSPVDDASGILVIAGDAQQGPPSSTLSDAVRFEVVDAAGAPVGGIEVAIDVVTGGGNVTTSDATTGADGIVGTTWKLGPDPGRQQIEARVAAKTGLRSTALACAGPCDPVHPLDLVSLVPLSTYEGSGQAVHPDVVVAPGFTGGYWLAATPYPGGNANFENPSLFQSADAIGWTVPLGLMNPIDHPANGAYLSDPDIVFNPATNELWLYYREVADGANRVRLVRSADGVHWSAPTVVASAPSHQIVSPAVVRGSPLGAWAMWSVNSGPAGCDATATTVELRTSSDGVHWNAPTAAGLAQPGVNIWHIDVQWLPGRGEYWAVYNTYAHGGTCTTDALYMAVSHDGTHWQTFPSPIARRGVIDALADIIYRSTFLLDPAANTVTFWYSGAAYNSGSGYVWRIATVTRRVDDLLAAAAAPAATILANPQRMLPPPEPDVGGGS
ncbi:MAG TPA: hypothetical protein VGM20_12290 [Gemmatimonadales bacterium]|jgi:hypothetical protein